MRRCKKGSPSDSSKKISSIHSSYIVNGEAKFVKLEATALVASRLLFRLFIFIVSPGSDGLFEDLNLSETGLAQAHCLSCPQISGFSIFFF